MTAPSDRLIAIEHPAEKWDVACPHCKAAPGEACTTSSGRRMTFEHAARRDLASAVFGDGAT